MPILGKFLLLKSPVDPISHLAYGGEGSKVTFTCLSLIQVVWLHKNSHPKHTVIEHYTPPNMYSITIPNIHLNDSGEYTCIGQAWHKHHYEIENWFSSGFLWKKSPTELPDQVKTFHASGLLVVGGDLNNDDKVDYHLICLFFFLSHSLAFYNSHYNYNLVEEESTYSVPSSNR